MDKPISMLVEELTQNLANVINCSGLHISIIKPIMGQLYSEICMKEKDVYENDKKQYIKENKKESETKE
jgi:hypothetical protein